MMKELERRAGRPIDVQPRYEFLAGLVSNGNRGVLLFFVINGYLIARPFLRKYRLRGKPVDRGAYYLRRPTRLEPPYVLILLLTSVVMIVAYGVSLRTLLPQLVASTFYLHGLVYHARSTISFIAWSLEIEAQFYLLAPLLGTIYMLRNTVVRRSVMVALMAVGSAYASYWRPDSVFNWTILAYLHYFMAGFLLADIVEGHPQQSHRGRGWDLVSLVGWPLAFVWPLDWQPDVVLPLLFSRALRGCVLWPSFQPVLLQVLRGSHWRDVLFVLPHPHAGDHVSLQGDQAPDRVRRLPSELCAAGRDDGRPVVLFGTLYYVAVERPCMDPRWPRRVWRILSRSGGSQPAVEPPNPAT